MELLIVIYHPQTPIRPVRELMTEVAGEYDRAMGLASDRHSRQTNHSAVMHLKWPAADLGWPHWHEDEQGALVTVGMPVLTTVPGSNETELVRPGKLAKLIRGGADGAATELGYCGGYFAAAHVGQDEQVRLVTNYMGEVPLYRAQGADGLTVWSTKAAAAALLAGVELRLDQRAVREYMLTSQPLENRTLLEGVEVEPAATCVMLDGGGVHRRAYLDLPRAYFEHRLPRDEAAKCVVAGMEPLIELLKQDRDRARLHLSGGMDSRTVGAICAHYGYQPRALTHNTPNVEVPAAKRLAKHFRMRYEAVEAWLTSAPEFFHLVTPSLWQSDGLMLLKYLCGRYDLELVRDEGYVPIEGYGGEHGRGYYHGSDAESRAKLNKGQFDKLYEKLIGTRAKLWPSPGGVQHVRGSVKQILDTAMDAGLDGPQAATWFYANQRARRWAAARRNVGWHWVIDPLQQPCWTYLAWSADPEDQNDTGLIRDVMDAALPGTSKLPTVEQMAFEARHRRVASNRLVRGGMKMYDRIKSNEPVHIQERMLDVLRPELTNYIREAEDLLPPFITADEADKWLTDTPWHYAQQELFWSAATLAMWSRQFLGSPPAIGCAAEIEHK